jgi:hypothetical protein
MGRRQRIRGGTRYRGTFGDSVKMLNAMTVQFQKICRDSGRSGALRARVALQRSQTDVPVLTTHSVGLYRRYRVER